MQLTMNERERLLKIIEEEGLNAKQFAEEVGIQAGTISNIVNGRNNPSLDVMQRVLNRFRTLNSDWLILGVGNMYRTAGNAQNDTTDLVPQQSDNDAPKKTERTLFSANTVVNAEKQPLVAKDSPATPRSIKKIMVFYSDGTFEEISR